MISEHIQKLIHKKGYSVRENETLLVKETLDILGVDSLSELGSLYLKYDPSMFMSNSSFEQQEDAAVATAEGSKQQKYSHVDTPIYITTQFVRDVWGVPTNFICLTSTEGEGAYLYDKNTEKVYDFDLNQQEELCNGTLPPKWDSFNHFLEWYLS